MKSVRTNDLAGSMQIFKKIIGLSLLNGKKGEKEGREKAKIKSWKKMSWLTHAGRRTKFAPGKSLRFFKLFLELSHFEFRFTVFFTLDCGVDSESPTFSFFKPWKEAPKEAWGGHLSGEGIDVTFLHPHEPQLSAMRCVTLNQIDPTYMICVRSLWYSTLSSPLPFCCDKISRKGQVFRSLARSGCIRKLFEV